MMTEHPVVDGGEVGLWRNRITEDGVFESAAHSVGDSRTNGKVHVGHPHGVQVVAPPARPEGLVHEVARTATLYDGREIVLHIIWYNKVYGQM